MELQEHSDELRGTAKFAEDVPQKGSIDSGENFYQINKDLMKSHSMFSSFLELTVRENRVSCTKICSKTTMTFRDNSGISILIANWTAGL